MLVRVRSGGGGNEGFSSGSDVVVLRCGGTKVVPVLA